MVCAHHLYYHNIDGSTRIIKEAYGKGRAVSLLHPSDLVISADTMVCYKGELMGKPKGEEDVYTMLRKLTGAVHEVITSYAIFSGGEAKIQRTCEAKIFLEKMADMEIEEYLETGSPLDKAGAYGIQDKDFINAKILSGDYYTVMGLPRDDLEDDLYALGALE